MNRVIGVDSELVPVYETSTGEKVVYGTDLHKVLQVKSRYREWADRRFDDIGATESIDSVNTNYLLCCNDECDFLAENLMVRNHPEIKVFKERGTFYYTVEDKE